MNHLEILLSYDFVSKKINLTWMDILYSIEKKYLPPSAAIEHAITEISYNDDFPHQIMDLAILNKDELELVYPFLSELANQVTEQKYEAISETWLYLLLEWVYEHKHNYSKPLNMVESIYADFDYPELIAPFVRYMPSDESDLGSIELNEARLYMKWKKYLDSQNCRFLKKIEREI